jgi:hypothetical protein
MVAAAAEEDESTGSPNEGENDGVEYGKADES